MMRSILLFGLLLSGLHAFTQTIYPSGVNGCIARWTFDLPEGGGGLTTIQDWSGNNNHGNNNNITSSAGWKGVAGKSGKFNGTSSWSEVMHSNVLNTPSEITMISVVKLDAFNNSLCQLNQIISKGAPNFIAGNYGLSVGEGPFDNDCNVFSPNYEQLVPQCGNTPFTPPAGNYMQLNKWYFLATTISPTTVINYMVEMDSSIKAPNMTPINTSNGSYNIGINNQSISIGKHLNPAYPYWINGEMDEVVIFNRVLTSAELYSVYEFIYGYPLNTSSVTDMKKFAIIIENGELTISTDELGYSYEIYNLMGQILHRKQHCSNSESVSLKGSSTEIVFVKIVDNKKRVSHHTKMIQ